MVSNDLSCATGQLRAWSGMKLRKSMWIVLSPMSDGRVVLKVAVKESPGTMSACDRTTGQTLTTTVAGDGVQLELVLNRTVVVHMAPTASTICAKPPPTAWLPVPGYNY